MIHFSSHSGIYTLKVVQDLKTNLNEAWGFFQTQKTYPKLPQRNGV